MKKPSEGSHRPRPKRHFLKINDFQYLCFNLAVELLSFNEPIPHYETRDNALLESALGSPSQTFGGKYLYPTLIKQAAILFYSLIKNHPFKNGNKRIALISLFAFLRINEKWINAEPFKLYLLACTVSKSNPKEKDKYLNQIEKFIKENMIDKSM
ncbi:type II toxin-antitoxin system death-on-curing family toxin [Patescibacteria group bacterium]|nr:type II toxin-antitoxin system death-on-curing family toxin [Patescibacteria group bacterium]